MAGWLLWGLDLALAILVLEGVVLARRNRRTGRGPSIRAVMAMTLAGFALILAIRIAVAEGPAWLVGLFVALGGLAHLVDVMERLRPAALPGPAGGHEIPLHDNVFPLRNSRKCQE